MTIERQVPKESVTTPEVRIHDWDHEGSELLRNSTFKILDTWRRDGIQMPENKYPSEELSRAVIDLDAAIGIEAIDICMPASGRGTPIFKQNVQIARYSAENYPQIERYVLARAKAEDIEATLRFADQVRAHISVILFRGSSDLRLLAENWDEEEIVESMARYTRELSTNGLRVIAATEDTTRTRQEFLEQIVLSTKTEGAQGFCISDTVGYADPMGVKKQIEWLRELVNDPNYETHFHGHNDTGNAVSNTISAFKAGASVGHVTWLGMGERNGNTPLEAILSDLSRRDIDRYNMLPIPDGDRLISQACNYPIPKSYPLAGANAFTHESGIHAAGVHKARTMKDPNVEAIVYSAVDPRKVGRNHETTIGPLSGHHNVRWELENREITFTQELEDALLKAAKINGVALNPEQISNVIRETQDSNGNGIK